jgi:F-box domain
MSERTISPGMDHINTLPRKNSLDIGTISQVAADARTAKRKWSPDHSSSSTATLTSQHEFLRTTGIASPHDSDPSREPKRTKVDESLPKQSPCADTVEKIPLNRSHLPGELWQYIFTFLPPSSLGRLMCVNTIFHSLLSPNGILPAPRLARQGRMSTMHQESLWSLSRRAFFPGMPRPLFSGSELRTWKLIQGNGCQFCGRTNCSTIPPVSASPWAAGPGNDYVRIIWPFAVRSCGDCLRTRLQKVCRSMFPLYCNHL